MSHIEWREIPGFDGVYEASSEGVIRRKKPGKKGGPGVVGKVITQFTAAVGYNRVGLRQNDAKRTFLVHRLVAAAFHGEPPREAGLTVNHKDGDKLNNRPENLEWCTRSENYRHALTDLGFQPPHGKAHWNVKKDEALVREIRRLARDGVGVTKIARDLGVPQSGVSLIVMRKSWAHLPD